MHKRPLALLLSTFMVMALVLAGCGQRPGQGELAAAATSDQLVVDLPALYIDYDAEGNPSFSGVPLSALGGLLGADLSVLNRTPEEIEQLQAAGIQHVLANITPDGVNVFANGMPLLSLGWDAESIASLGEVLKGMDNPDLAQVTGLLPMLNDLSVGVVMRVPTAEGVAELPLVAEAPDPAAVQAAAAAAAPAALTELLPDEMKGLAPLLGGLLAALPPLTVTFDADGVGQLAGLAPFIASQIPPGAISLPADQLESLQDMGIQTLNLKNSADGLAITVNGNALPTLLWNQGEMQNLGELGVEAGALKVLGLDDATLDTVKQVSDAGPLLQAAKLDVTINLPQ